MAVAADVHFVQGEGDLVLDFHRHRAGGHDRADRARSASDAAFAFTFIRASNSVKMPQSFSPSTTITQPIDSATIFCSTSPTVSSGATVSG